MPCCIGIIEFQRCRHSLLLKLACTNDCRELCPPGKQTALVITKYLWSCEDCHERKSNIDLDDRCNKWADIMMDLPECDAELHMAMENTVREREWAEDKICEKQRVQIVEEIQWVVEWTQEYGLMLYEVLYRKAWDPRRAAAKIKQLRDLRGWDHLVVKDALRSSKVLFEEQTDETYWYISDQFTEQYMLRKQLPQPPAPKRPPVPLFPWDEEDPGTTASETSKATAREEVDEDGDLILSDSEDEQPPTEQRPVTPSSPIPGASHSAAEDTARESSEADQPGDRTRRLDDMVMDCD